MSGLDSLDPPRRKTGQRGMTLVETMVGIVVGLLITLAALASGQLFMARQRQSVDVGSATGNAMTAMAAIQHEVAHAGIGFYVDGKLLCPRMNLAVGATAVRSNAPLLPLAIEANGGATTLDIFAAQALEAASPSLLGADASSAATTLSTASLLRVDVGQQVMLAPAPGNDLPCTVRTVSAVSAPTPTTAQRIDLAPGPAGFAAVHYTTDDSVTSLGQLQQTRFSLDGTDLLMARPLQSDQRVVMARRVMAFRADYGVSDGVTDALAGWQTPTGAWAAIDATQLPRVRAVRVGLVVRSDAPEKKDAAGACSATTAPPTLFGEAVTLTDPDWSCYRYRTSSVVVPLRNFIMGTTP